MEDLKDYMHLFNLSSTLTVKDDIELWTAGVKPLEKEVNYSNCIDLYSVIHSFNKLYVLFKRDYDNLSRLDLGKSISYLALATSKEENYRCLYIDIDKPKKEVCNEDDTLLCLLDNNGEISSIVTNDWPTLEDKKRINLEDKIVREYLDLAEKYCLFLDSYKFFKNFNVFGDGYRCIFSKVNGEIFDKLTTFEISFGNVTVNNPNYINVVFELGDYFKILYDESTVVFGTEIGKGKKEIIDKLIHGLFINTSKLSKMYADDNVSKLVKKLK